MPVLISTPYKPWWAQTQFHRSKACIRCIVAGRQGGKTHGAAEEVVKILCQRPGTTSCLLMPNYKSTKGTLKHLRRALKPFTGRYAWREVDKFFKLWNGAELYVRTSEDKEGVPTRGLTIDGVLWVDEAAYVPKAAFDAARFTQAAVADPLVIITTTPCGKNWVYDEWQAGMPPTPMHESFRFKSIDSPYCNAEFVETLKQQVGVQKAMQEVNAQFLGDAGAAVNPDDIAALPTPNLPIRGEQMTIGIDIAREVDYTVLVLMNEFGEAWILERFRHIPGPEIESKILSALRQYDAVGVIDYQHGGGYGGMMYDYLARAYGEKKLLKVKTGNMGVKAEVIEHMLSDIENRRLKVEEGRFWPHMRHELTFLERHREVIGGVERIKYHGPEGDGEDDHDDCVIALALACWGRTHAWTRTDPLKGDFSGFVNTETRSTGFGKAVDLGWTF